MLLSKSNIAPRIRQQPPSETKTNQHEERPNKSFASKFSTILPSSRAYQKLISKGLDLVELDPK